MSLTLYDCLMSPKDSCCSATIEGAFELGDNKLPLRSVQTLSAQYLLEAIWLGNVLAQCACVERGEIPGGISPCFWWVWGGLMDVTCEGGTGFKPLYAIRSFSRGSGS